MVYLHIPFCKSFCTYCDFYSEICPERKSAEVQKLFVDRVIEEIDRRSDEILAAAEPRTLYVGGGTPSVLAPGLLAEMVGHLKQVTGWTGFDEFTVEVNPEDVTPVLARDLASMGVNRVSMGVQSFDDGMLRWMNRRHNAAKAVSAFGVLRQAGFANISIDLISGISHLDDAVWEDTISKALDLHPEHVSAYQLSIEEGSALAGMVADGRYEPAAEEHCRRQYDILCRRLSEAGYEHYEISNFALSGYEAVHNSAYWRRVPYVGLGPGAHSFDGLRRSWNSQSLTDYASEHESLSEEEAVTETVMLALRTSEGISGEYLETHSSASEIKDLLDEGALVRSLDGRLRIPENHFFVSDDIIRRLI